MTSQMSCTDAACREAAPLQIMYSYLVCLFPILGPADEQTASQHTCIEEAEALAYFADLSEEMKSLDPPGEFLLPCLEASLGAGWVLRSALVEASSDSSIFASPALLPRSVVYIVHLHI